MKNNSDPELMTQEQLSAAMEIIEMVLEKAEESGLMEEYHFKSVISTIIEKWCDQTGRDSEEVLQEMTRTCIMAHALMGFIDSLKH